MATRGPAKPKPLANKPRPANVVDQITDVYLDEQSDKDYLIYGTATIEDRAIVGTYDGLKPVMRRLMYAMSTLNLHSRATTVKAALIVGETMGKYHPHGDLSIFQAAVAATQLPIPLIDGSDSNWGTMVSGSGAMRYINGRLTKYSDKVFFDKFYMPTVVMSPNYDGSYKEPVNLVTLLPNGLLNGNFGICPGVNTRTPAFTLTSVIKVLKTMIANKGECPLALCMQLEWISDYGGKIAKTAANKAALTEFFKTGTTSSVEWLSSYKIDDVKNTMRFDRFAPRSFNDKAPNGQQSPLERLVISVASIPGVTSIDSDGESSDPFRVAYIIRFNKTCKGAQRDAAVKRIEKLFSESQRYDVKVTDRVYNNESDMVDAQLKPITVPQLLRTWLLYRIKLERLACTYWIAERDKDIAYLELMRLAISKLDFIFACVRDQKLDDAQLVAKLTTGLKITVDQTNQILARNLRQLRHLEDKKLSEQITALNQERAGYQTRLTKPATYVLKHLDVLAAELSK